MTTRFGVDPVAVICTSDFSIATNYDALGRAAKLTDSGADPNRRRGGVPAPVRRPSLARRPSPGSDPSKATSPQAVWMLRQRTIVVLPLSGHFSANPGWQVDGFMFMLQLNFSDDQAAVLARKHIDFPR
jgi:hypothetical protein